MPEPPPDEPPATYIAESAVLVVIAFEPDEVTLALPKVMEPPMGSSRSHSMPVTCMRPCVSSASSATHCPTSKASTSCPASLMSMALTVTERGRASDWQ